MLPTGGITGFLQVHTKIHHIDQNLHMALRLHGAAHYAIADQRLAVLGDKGRNNGIKSALTRLIDVGVIFIHREQLATILEHKA